MKALALSLGFTEAQLKDKTDEEITNLIVNQNKALQDSDKVIAALVKAGKVARIEPVTDDDDGDGDGDGEEKVTMKMHTRLKKAHDSLQKSHDKLCDEVHDMKDSFKKMANQTAKEKAEALVAQLLKEKKLDAKQTAMVNITRKAAIENYDEVATQFGLKETPAAAKPKDEAKKPADQKAEKIENVNEEEYKPRTVGSFMEEIRNKDKEYSKTKKVVLT